MSRDAQINDLTEVGLLTRDVAAALGNDPTEVLAAHSNVPNVNTEPGVLGVHR
ncbi:unnamed protein product, partial [marine sediment metagenome]